MSTPQSASNSISKNTPRPTNMATTDYNTQPHYTITFTWFLIQHNWFQSSTHPINRDFEFSLITKYLLSSVLQLMNQSLLPVLTLLVFDQVCFPVFVIFVSALDIVFVNHLTFYLFLTMIKLFLFIFLICLLFAIFNKRLSATWQSATVVYQAQECILVS